VLVEVVRRGQDVVLTVRNRGTVEPHVKDRLFRRFVTTRREKGGTGLGLAIVQAVAEAHGGLADLESAGPPDVTFRVKLPAARLRATLAEGTDK
jgi:two-component system, OmpR family, sensor histidine kinase CreC